MPNPSLPPTVASASRDVAIGHLRSFVTLLVVAHHAVLAYLVYAPPTGGFTGDNLLWAAFPVVDPVRAPGLELFTTWNDTFFMALMFLLAGLFTWPSLERKGGARYLRDRLLRLGLPFAAGSLLLAPLAYYPAWLLRTAAPGRGSFWTDWLALGSWPSGPVWFLWVLLVFGVLAALLHRFAPRAVARLAGISGWVNDHPVRLGVVFSLVAVVAYVPLTHVFNPFGWSRWGPFTVQSVRALLYAAFFFLGVVLGARPDRAAPLLRRDGALVRRWSWWHGAAWMVFAAFMVALVLALMNAGKGLHRPMLGFLASVGFAVTGVVTSLSLFALFGRWCDRENPVGASLARNAFGMYLLHYPLVSWLQYGLLGAALPAAAKVLLVTLGAVGLSWAGTAALRRIPPVARVLG